MEVTLAGIVTFVRLSQPMNAREPIEVIPSEITTSSIVLFALKQDVPIVVTGLPLNSDGTVTEVFVPIYAEIS